MPRHSSSASNPPRPVAVSGALVTGSRVESSRPVGRPASVRSTVRSRPLCYRAATDADQSRATSAPPSGARTSTASSLRVHGRTDLRRRPGRDAPHRRPRDGQRCAARGGRVQPVLRGSPRPRRRAHEHPVRAADDHLRPDRQDRARSPRRPQARAGHLRPAAGRDHRCDDGHRGQGFLGQRRVRSGGHRVGRPRYPVGPSARRVHDHPAARPGATPPAGGVRGHDL